VVCRACGCGAGSYLATCMDLRHFTLEDMHRCSAALRAAGASASSSHEAAARIVSYLFEELRDPDDGTPECPLVRLFRVVTHSTAIEELHAAAPGGRESSPSEREQRYLVLEASRGVRPEWNDPARSVAHRLIPLSSPGAVARLPMVSGLLSQLEVPPAAVYGPPLVMPEVDRLYSVFHVEDVLGNPLVPDQDGFVRPYGVRSVLGFGGLLPGDEVFATL